MHVNFLSGGCGARTQTISTRGRVWGGEGHSAASGDLADFLQTEKRDAGRGKQSPLSLFSHDGCKRQNSGDLQQVEKIQRSREKKGHLSRPIDPVSSTKEAITQSRFHPAGPYRWATGLMQDNEFIIPRLKRPLL